MRLRVTKGSQFSRPVRLELTKSELIFPDVTYNLAEVVKFKIAGTRSRALRILSGACTAIGSILIFAWFPPAILYYFFSPNLQALYDATKLEAINPTTVTPAELWTKLHESDNSLIAFFANFGRPGTQILIVIFIAYFVPYVLHPLIARKRFHIQFESGEKVVTDYMLAMHPIIYIYNWRLRLPIWVTKRSKRARRNRPLAN